MSFNFSKTRGSTCSSFYFRRKRQPREYPERSGDKSRAVPISLGSIDKNESWSLLLYATYDIRQ